MTPEACIHPEYVKLSPEMAYSHAIHAKYDHGSKNSSKAVPNMAFFSDKHSQNASMDRSTIACKVSGQKRGIETSDICKPQMDKLSSTTLKMR
ncbi:hypothetical protein LOK49_LG14G01311 [Camellia lanceoleosa]|uniref:Uncharacterized protein n=1 Tax=Camellia lanceoleosa TaxID=1840588 RepID=A0ACC0FB57_9ERIC|nr:hypothetical protein LOK49_LG14G01311 [Camellia lanceoleosa]